jgi:hypothetical protein
MLLHCLGTLLKREEELPECSPEDSDFQEEPFKDRLRDDGFQVDDVFQGKNCRG